MNKNVKELIMMVEAQREEYYEYLEDTAYDHKKIRYRGAIEGFHVVLGELRDIDLYVSQEVNIKEFITWVEDQREEYRDYLEDTTYDHKRTRYAGVIEGFNVVLNELRDMQ